MKAFNEDRVRDSMFRAFLMQGGIFYIIFAGLLLPMVWYGLRTRFALIDDYNAWYGLSWVTTFTNPIEIPGKLFFFESHRFRPVFHLYNLLTWFFFEQNYSLHHALRIVLKLCAGWYFWRIIKTWAPTTPGAIHLPSFVFWALFLFFPNNPEARLAPQETLLVTTLAWLLWSLTRLVWENRGDLFANRRLYVEMFLAFTLFIGCKEPAIPQAVVLIFFFIWLSLRKPNRLLGVLPFIAVLIYPAIRSFDIYNQKIYGTSSLTLDLLQKNLAFLLNRLTFLTAQPVLAILFSIAAGWIVWRFLRGIGALVTSQKFQQVLFYPCEAPETYRPTIGILLGLLFAVASLLSLTSWQQELRYIYTPMVLWILIVSLSAEIRGNPTPIVRFWIVRAAIAFGFLFIFINYYNFIYQFAAQYYTRANEARMLNDVRKRLDRKETVYVVLETEFQYKVRDYFFSYLPFFEGVTFPSLYFVKPAQLSREGTYYLTLSSNPLPGHSLEQKYLASEPSRYLEWIETISRIFNLGHDPFVEVDDGAQMIGATNWYLYKVGQK